jgi:hypothetical protein
MGDDIVKRLREIAERAAEIERLRGAVAIFADPHNWRHEGKLDPNSGNFSGVIIAAGKKP